MQSPHFILKNIPNSKSIAIIIHGSNNDIYSNFISSIAHKFENNSTSTLRLQMPFKDRGENHSSSSDLKEELHSVEYIMHLIEKLQFEELHFVGKSLGAIILSKYLANCNEKLKSKSKFSILGCVVDHITIPCGLQRIHIIQGEKDKHGSQESLMKTVDQSGAKHVKITMIHKADHSYRDAEKQPIYQNKAIELL